MKLLLLGADGQVGWELRRSLATLGPLTIAGRADGADFADPERLADTVRRLAPEVIVNAAAYTAVDRAESEPALAQTINADAPGALARVAAASGAWLVHYSSDYVFDGSGQNARGEDDPTGPLSAYGRSKLAGEAAIRSSGCHHLILRTSWVYAARGGNFARTMLKLAGERDELKVIDDQIGAPTGAELLADLTALMLRDATRRPELAGTYHACAAGETSWCGYARHVIAWARSRGVALRTAPDAVQAIPSSAYPLPARRPLNSRLATTKLRSAFGVTLPPWQPGVERMLAEALNLPLALP
ncbi:dTDP-4-dehydrorhamnose reductase [Aquincola sp. S2]|uniref:dTDP-4-dehydrorhamnose reductase n=1 Tax=Pseudaquabacterium terrae TaxID=2732868 RepID=A0ABX2EDY6_9BURK|nr:dTDP-4-dehydrorhamnose reductase [Aquabacterium terrae]NRF66826.1 dTDP-4-dehydrorhamnose reductase [Aquabacterium terrae]